MRYIFLLSVLMLSTVAFAQDFGNYPKIDKSLLLRDLEILYQGLDKYHTGMYWYTTTDSVETAFREARQSITSDLNIFEFHKIIAPLVTLSREDHTNIFLPEAIEEQVRKQAKFFPAMVAFLGKELYLLKNGSSNNSLWEGAKIISINGESIEDIVSKLGNLFPSDGYIKLVKYSDLRGFEFSRFYYYYYGNVTQFTIELEGGNVLIDALNSAEINKNLAARYKDKEEASDTKESLEFTLLNDSTAYMGLHTFANSSIKENSTNKKFAPFIEQSFQTIEERNIKHLIIDVSENGGGNEGNENLVYSYLGSNYQKYKTVKAKTQAAILDNGIDKPIKLKTFGFFERIFGNKRNGDGSLERKKNIGFGLNAYKKEPNYKYDGKLYVLIGPITYSGGSEFSNMLYTNDLATFIGQETGGGYYGNTSGYSEELTLPHSKIIIDIPALQFVMNVANKIPFGRGVIPDYEVIPSFEQYINGQNAALAFALNLIRKEN